MKINQSRLMEIIKEETRSLVKEEEENYVPDVSLKYIELSDDGGFAKLALGKTGGKSDGEIQKALFALGVYHPDQYDRSNPGNTLAIWEPDDAMGETVEDFIYRMKEYDDAWIEREKHVKPVPRNESRQKNKLTKTRLMEIIKEEVVKEVTSDKQRRFMCAMKDKSADERPEGLSKDEAEEMCTGPMKEEELEEGLFGFGRQEPETPSYAEYPDIKRDKKPIDTMQARNIEDLMQRITAIIDSEESNEDSTPDSKRQTLKRAQNLIVQAVMRKVLDEALDEGWFGLGGGAKKQTNKTLAMAQHAGKTLRRFNGGKENKLEPSDEDELQKISDEEESDKSYAALLQKMKASGQLQEEE